MKRHEESGFTLIEVMVALAIFSIGTLGVLALTGTAITLNANSRQFSEASLVGQWKLDELLTEPTTNLDYTGCTAVTPRTAWCRVDGGNLNTAPTSAKTVTLSALGGNSGSNDRFQAIWTTTLLSGGTEAGITALTVVVYWPRQRNAMGLSETDTGFIDCVANSSQCFSLEFHGYRR